MKNSTLIFFMILVIGSFAQSTWRKGDPDQKSAVFTQFKYFSFYSEDVSGHIAYAQLSPQLIDQFYIVANVIVKGQQYTMLQPIDKNCVAKSPTSTTVLACNMAGIVESSEGFRVYSNFKNIKWNLNFKKSKMFGKIRTYNTTFADLPAYENLIGMAIDSLWTISWQPMDLALSANGSITVNDKTINIENITSYHDDTWGNWNFLTQPYFWLYFANNKEADHNLQFVIGDIYFNKADRFMGLTLIIDGKVVRYKPEDYWVVTNETKPTASIDLPLLLGKSMYAETNMKKLAEGNITHQYASKVTVISKDGRLKVGAQVKMVTPYKVVLPLGAEKIFPAAWLDDAVVEVNYEFQKDDGQVIKGSTFGGMEYFFNERYGLPSVL